MASHSLRCPSWGKCWPLSPLPLARSWSSSRWPSTPDEQVHHAAFFFHAGHRWPPPSEHLWPHHHFKKNRSSMLFDHVYTFTVPDLRSEPSSTHRHLPSPPLDLCVEPPSTLLPPTGSPWSGVPPRHHLVWRVTTGRSESTGGAAPVKGGLNPLSSPSGRKAKVGRAHSVPAEPNHYRSRPSAQCHFIISICIYSIQIQI
jgi:hypothetical protein